MANTSGLFREDGGGKIVDARADEMVAAGAGVLCVPSEACPDLHALDRMMSNTVAWGVLGITQIKLGEGVHEIVDGLMLRGAGLSGLTISGAGRDGQHHVSGHVVLLPLRLPEQAPP